MVGPRSMRKFLSSLPTSDSIIESSIWGFSEFSKEITSLNQYFYIMGKAPSTRASYHFMYKTSFFTSIRTFMKPPFLDLLHMHDPPRPRGTMLWKSSPSSFRLIIAVILPGCLYLLTRVGIISHRCPQRAQPTTSV